MTKTLLPSSATPQERAFDAAASRIELVPLPARDMWNPDKIKAAVLPWLAWQASVDEWDTNWTEAEKRAVIKSSLEVHKHKGTIGAIERALTPLGYVVGVIEWWEMSPPGEPYTFSIELLNAEKPVTADLYDKAERVIASSKNLRSHLSSLKIKTEIRGGVCAGAAIVDGAETTVYPYSARAQKVQSAIYFGVCLQDAATTTVFPKNYFVDAEAIIAANERVYEFANHGLTGLLP
ncbi:phage tail protein I [Xanthomonas sacchari]|uniref:phage tail protein I n=1 Tax=Xanthomonas sacchari TaxID=56458 RepID=UPI003B215B75